MKQKWLQFVTRYNQRALKDHRIWLGPVNRDKVRPILLLHGTRIFQIQWVLKK